MIIVFCQNKTNLEPIWNCHPYLSVSVCHLLRSGVAAIFGPQSAHTASHVQSICDTMEIPHLETRWDYRLRRESCLVNLYPHPTTLSKVMLSLIVKQETPLGIYRAVLNYYSVMS